MQEYRFALILPTSVEMTEELGDALFEAGCDDSVPGVRCGVPRVDFLREAESLGTAVQSAIANVRAAGVEVERVELDPTVVEQLVAAGV